jgi:hypothetical protein
MGVAAEVRRFHIIGPHPSAYPDLVNLRVFCIGPSVPPLGHVAPRGAALRSCLRQNE